MKNLLEQLANGGGEVTSEDFGGGFRVEINGSFIIKKGELSYKQYFYSQLSTMQYKNCVCSDESYLDGDDDYKLGGLVIDNLTNLKNSLKDSGLSTIASSLEICNEEVRKQMFIRIANSEIFKRVFGEDALLWDTLEEDERDFIKLEHAIERYDGLNEYATCLSKYVKLEEEEQEDGTVKKKRIKPTLKELKNALVELKNK
jgi:hypothetical protein